ncbi:hypothetical protein [Stappia indica]|uniref:hypothetical protein n=1 Tax=Stappia indica TaxID=538381 RepID=UPI001CD5CB74|nr:hypothetical protein [Stappia indica]MCA1300256.1 hypothetical protein [Stappia indica]
MITELGAFYDFLQGSPVAVFLAGSALARDLTAFAHVIGAAMLFGAILPFDLRMLGLWPSVPLSELARVLVPVSAVGFLLALATGLAMMSLRPHALAALPGFQLKMGLIALAGLNALMLRIVPAWRLLAQVDSRGTISRFRTAGLISLALWLGVLAAGRWQAGWPPSWPAVW